MKELSSSEEESHDLSEDLAPQITAVNYGNLTVFSKRLVHLSLGPDCINT
jgi:hypothetical protein